MKWEYLERCNPSIKVLNELGEQGWELVAINPNNWYIFKRQIIENN